MALGLLRELAKDMRRNNSDSVGNKLLAFVCVDSGRNCTLTWFFFSFSIADFSDEAAEIYMRSIDDHTDFSSCQLDLWSTPEMLSKFDVVVSSHQVFLEFMNSRKIGL